MDRKPPAFPPPEEEDKHIKEELEPGLLKRMRVGNRKHKKNNDSSEGSKKVLYTFIGLTVFFVTIFGGAFVDHGRKSAVLGEFDRAFSQTLDQTVLKALECKHSEEELEEYARQQFYGSFRKGYQGADSVKFVPVVMNIQGEIRFKAETEIPNYFLALLGTPSTKVYRERRIMNYRDYAVKHLDIKESIADRCVMVLPR